MHKVVKVSTAIKDNNSSQFSCINIIGKVNNGLKQLRFTGSSW